MSGFLKYTKEHIGKVNAIRRTVSQPDIYTIPIPSKSQVLFVSAAEMHNEPASCANCTFYNWGKSCQLIGPHIKVKKFTYGAPDKNIEYWPCCGMQTYGEPNRGEEKFIALTDPASIDLLWINAPEVGLKHGGANCGGQEGGDDCDYYMTDKPDKRDCPTGFCRVLQTTVTNGDVCCQWRDDDRVNWEEAQAIINKQEG